MRQGWKTLTVVAIILSCFWVFTTPVVAADSPEGLTIEKIEVVGNVTLTPCAGNIRCACPSGTAV